MIPLLYENGIGYYTWDVDSGGTPLDGTYRATVAGSDLAVMPTLGQTV